MSDCPFCQRIEQGDVSEQNDLAAAFFDGFPLSEGHSLIVPLRHCEITDPAGHPAIICLDDRQGGPDDERSTRNSSKEENS